ncbi:MAG: OmpA family protein [Candidatus Edwardsbacteria bacterium]|jgi:outer membrane protein OmpA-like peptidoglycan-associated protein/opacity protein-like surface antigen|nr:OmpA family protein [Candidatus Edwardsbacteria bacterium]
MSTKYTALALVLALCAGLAVSQTPAPKPSTATVPAAKPATPAAPAAKKEEPKPAPVKSQASSSILDHLLVGGQVGACKLIDSPWHEGGFDQSTIGFVGDVMFGYSFSPVLSLRADLGLGLLGTKEAVFEPIAASNFSTTVIPVSVDVLYRLLRKPAFSPYLIAGVGIMPWSQGVDADTLKDAFSGDLKTNVVFGGGLGLQYAFSKRMSAFLEGRYHYFGNKAATNGALDTNNAIVRGSLGIAMNLFCREDGKPALASVKGKVTDKAGKGIDASVLVGPYAARTNPATGEFTIANAAVQKEPYTVKAEASGFLPKTATLVVGKQHVKTPATVALALDPVPVKPGTVAGLVADYKSGAPLAAARLVLNGPKTQTLVADAKGAYTLTLDPGSYELLVKADGYNDKTVKFSVKDGEAQKQTVALVKRKEVFAFENINFAVGKAAFLPGAETVLAQLLKVLQENPEISVEIAGHTDKMGSPKKNLVLSQARAAAVVKWLMDKGVGPDRMVSKGYGDTKPVASNKTKEGRAKNRRIEIAVREVAAAPASLIAPAVPAAPKP